MQILRYVSPLLSANMYVLAENRHCIVIDPFDCPPANDLLAQWAPDFILVTHEHYDHISGVNALKERFGIPLYANAPCDGNMRDPRKNFAKYEDAYVKFQKGETQNDVKVDAKYVCQADRILQDDEVLAWQGHTIQLKMAPGHSAGSNLILLDDDAMFSGDSMLPESFPAARFPGGDMAAFERVTLPYLQALNGSILVYPGHGDAFLLKTYYRIGERTNGRK